MNNSTTAESSTSKPWGLKWRSSVGFITFSVALGITIDLLVYSIAIPVFPFRLEAIGYHGVSALVGWILFAYSGGLVISTPPVAMFSERYQNRRVPYILGLLVLLGSQAMLMEAPVYWVMCLARVIQGISSSVVWVVGLALLCDTAPESTVGRQLGLAMMGVSIGVVVGSPVGGGLYGRFGFRGPFIFGMIATLLDLLARLLIIERKEALKYGHDPAAVAAVDSSPAELEEATAGQKSAQPVNGLEQKDTPREDGHELEAKEEMQARSAVKPVERVDRSPEPTEKPDVTPARLSQDNVELANPAPKKHLSLLQVVARLASSPRALTSLFNTVVWGVAYSSFEPAMPLHMQRTWGYDSTKVGLVFIAGVIPTFFASPLAGWVADKRGVGWVSVISILLSLPWWIAMVVPRWAAFFIVSFAVANFFTSGVITPLTMELAIVSRTIDGVGYAHVYGAFNLAYGIGAALGPVIGGQIYGHLKHGWTAVCLISAALLSVSAALSFRFTGDDPLWSQLRSIQFRERTTENA